MCTNGHTGIKVNRKNNIFTDFYVNIEKQILKLKDTNKWRYWLYGA